MVPAMVMTIIPSLDGLDHFLWLYEVVPATGTEGSALPDTPLVCETPEALVTRVAEVDPRASTSMGKLVRLAVLGAPST
jgi:hypothetical protein